MGVIVTEKRTSELIRVLGLSSGSEIDSRTLSLLKVILRLQQKDAKTLTFARIYDAMINQEIGVKLSKTWVHRVLKSLVDSILLELSVSQLIESDTMQILTHYQQVLNI
jgi:hypothetical protein